METFTLLGFEITGGFQFAFLFIGLIAIFGNVMLFVKAGLPGWAVFVPVYNVMIAMKLIGRPKWHAFLFFTPVLVYLLPRTILEVAQSFGKHKTIDFILVLIFNIFYILNLALSHDEKYVGPVYGKSLAESSTKINSSGGVNIAH